MSESVAPKITGNLTGKDFEPDPTHPEVKRNDYFYKTSARPPSYKYPQTVGEDFNNEINYNTHDSSEFAKQRNSNTNNNINEETAEPFMFFEFLTIIEEKKYEQHKAIHDDYYDSQTRSITFRGQLGELALDARNFADYDETTKTSAFQEQNAELIEAVAKDPEMFDKARREYNGSIALYMPTDIQINDTIVYNEDTRQIMGSVSALNNDEQDDFINATTGTNIGVLTAMSAVAGFLSKRGAGALTKLAAKATGNNAAIKSRAAAILGKFGTTTAAILGGSAAVLLAPEAQRSTGKALNPHEFMAYGSTGMRNFTFSWTMLPDSQEESDQCSALIKHFRMAAHATREGALRVTVPDHVIVSFHGARDMIQLPAVVIESVNVIYNPNNSSFFKQNNAPVEIGLSVTLKEIVPIYRQDVMEGF